jgi:hypothetical protein
MYGASGVAAFIQFYVEFWNEVLACGAEEVFIVKRHFVSSSTFALRQFPQVWGRLH